MATVVLTAVLAVLFLAAAERVHSQIVTAFNRQSVADLAQGALSRAEIATDYAVIKLGELHENGQTDCSRKSVEALNYAVFSSGSIKDILTARGGTICSVAMHNETLVKNYFNPVDSAAARNENIVLNPVRLAGHPALAVTWNFDDGSVATALVSTETLVFDVLPEDFRETSAIRLSLSNGRTVGSFEGPGWEIGGDTQMFAVRSERYPLVARIHVPTASLYVLNRQRSIYTELAAVVLALALAYLVARGLIPTSTAASRVRRALRRGEIAPVFQPIYEVESGEITSFEVLARWTGQSGSMASPAYFIPLIEANGWSGELLGLMLSKTAQAMESVITSAPQVKFAFNVSPAQFADPGFATWLAGSLDTIGLESERVTIEITEREEICDIDSARTTTEALGRMAIEVAIDDAGTGHNGMAAIQRLGAAVLKIDKLFVDGVAHDPRAGALIQVFVDVAREFGMRTVAEGVEEEIQLEVLKRLGVDEVQGFYLCRPLDADAAVAELARHQAILTRGRLRGEDPDRRGSDGEETQEPIAMRA